MEATIFEIVCSPEGWFIHKTDANQTREHVFGPFSSQAAAIKQIHEHPDYFKGVAQYAI